MKFFRRLLCLLFGCRGRARWLPRGPAGPLAAGHCWRCGRYWELDPVPPPPPRR